MYKRVVRVKWQKMYMPASSRKGAQYTKVKNRDDLSTVYRSKEAQDGPLMRIEPVADAIYTCPLTAKAYQVIILVVAGST